MDIEELKRLLADAYDQKGVQRFNKELDKASKSADAKTKKELDQLKKLSKAREELIRSTGNLQRHFTKFGKNVGLSDKAAKRFGEGMENTSGFIGGFGKAIAEGSGSVTDFTAALKEFGPIGEMFARFGATLGSSVDMYRTLSSVGASFSQNLIELRETAARAGLPLSDFIDLIGKNSASLAALYGTTSEGARRFSDLAQQFRQTQIAVLAPLGLTVEELNEQLLTNLTLSRRLGTFRFMSDQQHIDSGAKLIKQLDRLAKLTGIQRDQLAATMESQLSNSKYLAFLTGVSKKTSTALLAFTSGVEEIAGPQLAEGLQDLIANAGVPVTQAAQDLVKNMPEVSGIVTALTNGSISTEQAMVKMKEAAIRSNTVFKDVAQTGVVDWVTSLFGPINKLATIALDTAGAMSEQDTAADKLTQELTQFESASKNLSSAFQGVQTSFLSWIGNFLGTGVGGLTETMNNLATDIKGLSTGTQAALYGVSEVVKTVGGLMRDTAPITMGTYAALRMWGPMGPGGLGGGLGKLGKAGKLLGKAGGIGLGVTGALTGGNIADQATTGAGTALGIGGAAASGALAGAMIGGPLGALIGGLGGAAWGAFRASDWDDVLGEKLGIGQGNQKAFGTIGTTGNVRETNTNLATIHAGERVLTKTETDAYLSSKATGGDGNKLLSMGTKWDQMNTKMSTMVNEMKTFNMNVNTLVGINTETMKNTDRTQRRLAKQTESLV